MENYLELSKNKDQSEINIKSHLDAREGRFYK